MIAIVDCGVGNLHSVQKAIEHVGARAVITAEAEDLQAAEGLILPGVGAFGDAMDNLRRRRLIAPLQGKIEAGKPLLGICLGMQLLFEESEEMGRHRGLGVLRGRVVRLPPPSSPAPSHYRVPHVGWNQIDPRREDGLLEGIAAGSYAYFVHAYYVVPTDGGIVRATTTYGPTYPSVVGQGLVWGVQFHPEKSQGTGLQLLKNFLKIVRLSQEGRRAP